MGAGQPSCGGGAKGTSSGATKLVAAIPGWVDMARMGPSLDGGGTELGSAAAAMVEGCSPAESAVGPPGETRMAGALDAGDPDDGTNSTRGRVRMLGGALVAGGAFALFRRLSSVAIAFKEANMNSCSGSFCLDLLSYTFSPLRVLLPLL